MTAENKSSTEEHSPGDHLDTSAQLISQEVPPGVECSNFLMRSAVVGAAAVMTGRPLSAHERIEKAIATMPEQSKGS